MMKEVGMRTPDLGGDGLQSDGLRTLLQKQLARGLERGGPAFFRVQASTAY